MNINWKELGIACLIAIVFSVAVRTAFPIISYCSGNCAYDDGATYTNPNDPYADAGAGWCYCGVPKGADSINVISWFAGGLVPSTLYLVWKNQSKPKLHILVGMITILIVLGIWVWALIPYYFHVLHFHMAT